MRRNRKKLLILFLLMVMLLLDMQVTYTYAGNTYGMDNIEKKEPDAKIYELYDEEGNIIAYFKSNLTTSSSPSKLRYTSSISWTIAPKIWSCGVNQFTLTKDSEIDVEISQSAIGNSYLGLYDRTRSTWYRFSDTLSSNGWKGTLVVVRESVYSLGIENVSDLSITYDGTYTL